MLEVRPPICQIVSRAVLHEQRCEPERRPPGRPRTRTREHYEALWSEYLAMRAWFFTVHQRETRSDVEVLTAYLKQTLLDRGQRSTRIGTPEVNRKLKTLRNELCIARRLHSAK
jgi:hypothetical protein